MSFAKFKELFARFFATGNLRAEKQTLPEDVFQLLPLAKASRLVVFLDWAGAQPEREEIFRELNYQVVKCSWGSDEIAKLKAYMLYFSNSYRDAYSAASSFLEDKNFDPEYYGIASMSLYNGNQFDQAYSLLRSIKKNENALLASQDYQLSATLICWSAGDRYLANKYIDLGMRTTVETGMMTFNSFAIYFELGDEGGLALAQRLMTDDVKSLPNFQYALAFIELAKNNYTDGLMMAEARYRMPEAYRYMRKELLDKARWHGENIESSILLVHGEQGLGDMIQTARYFDQCIESAARVIVECPPESIALLEFNFPKIKFIPLDSIKPLGSKFDIWTGTLSLPYVFRSEAESIPKREGYLSVPNEHLEYWQDRVHERAREHTLKVGIAWSGYPGHRADRRRSIPWLLVRELIAQNSNIDFFAVQTVVPDALPDNLYDCTDELATLSDTAALISQMDLIISVDTSVVHIAGAIGKETWMMLPYRYEWRWGLEGEWNPWYESVRVIRQPSPGAWAPVLSHVFGKRLREFRKK